MLPNTAKVKKYQDKHKKLGLCIHCSKPAFGTLIRCLECNAKNNKYSRKHRNKESETT